MVHKANISVYSNVNNIIYGEYRKHRYDIDVDGNNNNDGMDKNVETYYGTDKNDKNYFEYRYDKNVAISHI